MPCLPWSEDRVFECHGKMAGTVSKMPSRRLNPVEQDDGHYLGSARNDSIAALQSGSSTCV